MKDLLESSGRTETFNTAVSYQFYHSLGLLIIGALMFKVTDKLLGYAAWAHMAGILFFSGSLYILCLTANGKWGAVTPIGGLLFLVGWVLMTLAIVRSL